jgi:hypothetical protein
LRPLLSAWKLALLEVACEEGAILHLGGGDSAVLQLLRADGGSWQEIAGRLTERRRAEECHDERRTRERE